MTSLIQAKSNNIQINQAFFKTPYNYKTKTSCQQRSAKLKLANEIRGRDKKEIKEKKTKETQNLFGKLISNKTKQVNLFEN